MTRRKAIETAVAKAWELDNEPSHSHEAAAIAYDMGRIAGLREAAAMTIRHDGGWTPMVGMVKRKARALAKELKQC